MTRSLLLTSAVLLASCGPKSLTLPEQPIDRAATCGVVAVAEGRLGTADIKAPLPFEAMGRVLHYTLLAGSAGESFSSEAAADVQKRMTDLRDSITGGKWQELIPVCRAAFPATEVREVKLPADRFDAQLGCYELGDFMRSALEEQGKYDNELGAYRQLGYKLDAAVGPSLRARVGSGAEAQQQARGKALVTMAKAGSPVAVMKECVGRFG